MNVIEASKLTKYYGHARGIEGIDLQVAEGDIFGFIGPNGAGKSTTIRSLLGLIKPSSGEASVLGHSYENYTEILREVGYMPSEAMFYSSMKVKEVIELSANLREIDCKEEAMRLCKRFDLDVSRRIEELSLGNRKKVSIICAFQHKPKLYILDEPTSGLDPLMQKEFFSLLHERNEGGATIFLSSHVLSEIAKHCHHAAIIKEGKIIACDRVDAITKTNAKKVILHGVSDIDIKGMYGKEVQSDSIRFLYGGDMPSLIQQLQGLPITDLSIAEPDLEEIFLHFYGGEQK